MRGVLRDVRRLLDWSIGAFPSVFHLTLLELKRNTVLDRTILDGSGDRDQKDAPPPEPPQTLENVIDYNVAERVGRS